VIGVEVGDGSLSRVDLRAAQLSIRLATHRATTAVAAAAILGIGAYVRLAGINTFGFNSDEAVYAGQAAALAGHQEYAQLFGVFRAHPLLVHLVVSLVYRVTGVDDLSPRIVSVVAGLGMVLVAFAIGTLIRGRLVGLLTMLFVALTPYAVVVSRQLLLDGPMAFFFALTMLFLAIYVRRPGRLALFAAACSAGLALLSKETAILMAPAILVFFLLASDVPVRIPDLLRAIIVYLVTIAPFPLALLLNGGQKLAQQFFVWQIFRRPNHDPTFYLSLVPSLTYPLVAFALVGTIMALRRRKGIDLLILALPAVMIAFFQVWPVKGFQYLIPIVTPVALLAADGVIGTGKAAMWALVRLRVQVPQAITAVLLSLALALTCVVVLSLGTRGVISAPEQLIAATDSDDQAVSTPAFTFTAGTGGLEASRPVGVWARQHTLPDARFLTIGPSFANVIEFYGQRRTLALSVSPNPLHRNPTYQPVVNADLLLRTNAIQYLVYDSYSAARTPFFSQKLMGYVRKYNGILVHGEYQTVPGRGGTSSSVPVVLIYQVHP
jgi:hypothetical protein